MKDSKSGAGEKPINVPLLEEYSSPVTTQQLSHHIEIRDDLPSRVRIESKKLWHIVGPTIFSRITSYSMFVITQAFDGHLGNLEPAAVALSSTVIVGFCFGLLLGMASALETLCGQAYGAKQYHMLGIYMQRSCVFLTICAILLLPLYIFTTPFLKLLGQLDDIAELSGLVTIWLIPLHFAFASQFPLQRFLQCQLKTPIIAWVCLGALLSHTILNWLVIYKLGFVLGLFSYIAGGGCPETWTGFSMQAFSGLWEFFKLSVASGIMLCLENWYYRILVLMTGNLNNATVAVSALTVCMSINGLEMMITLAFFAATGKGCKRAWSREWKAAKFAYKVSAITSLIVGIFFCTLIMIFHQKLAIIYTTSDVVLQAVDILAILLAFTILLNNIQHVLSGTHRLVFVIFTSPLRMDFSITYIGEFLYQGYTDQTKCENLQGIWSGMIGDTAVQTLIFIIITIQGRPWAQNASSRMNMLSKPSGKP
ncbi:hypothetical protein MKX01_041522 [Papaver californicum]|nr:hypothetical protein MKX01_041522 [Papaver californicum]